MQRAGEMERDAMIAPNPRPAHTAWRGSGFPMSHAGMTRERLPDVARRHDAAGPSQVSQAARYGTTPQPNAPRPTVRPTNIDFDKYPM